MVNVCFGICANTKRRIFNHSTLRAASNTDPSTLGIKTIVIAYSPVINKWSSILFMTNAIGIIFQRALCRNEKTNDKKDMTTTLGYGGAVV